MTRLIDTDHPAFRPLWRRVAVVLVCFGWGIVEVVTGNPFWATIFLGLGAYCCYAFFVAFNPRSDEKDTSGK